MCISCQATNFFPIHRNPTALFSEYFLIFSTLKMNMFCIIYFVYVIQNLFLILFTSVDFPSEFPNNNSWLIGSKFKNFSRKKITQDWLPCNNNNNKLYFMYLWYRFHCLFICIFSDLSCPNKNKHIYSREK